MPVVIPGGPDQRLTFEEMWLEVLARGFSDMGEDPAELARVKRWVNAAYREICDFAPWPFLEALAEGTAPLEIERIAHVLAVVDVARGTTLRSADRRELLAYDPSLTGSGQAVRWYMEGETALKVYPLDETSEFSVRYVQTPEALVGDEDTPVLPGPYHELIVEGAVIRAYRNRDNYDAARLVREEWKLGIENMVKALVKRNMDQERKLLRTGRSGDYL